MAPAVVHFRLLVILDASATKQVGPAIGGPRHQLRPLAEVILAKSVLANGQAAVARARISGCIIGIGLELAANGSVFLGRRGEPAF